MKNLNVIKNPIVCDLITKLRNIQTPSSKYQKYTKLITPFLIYNALKDAKTEVKKVKTQTNSKYEGKKISKNIAFIAIMRAGLGMLIPAIDFFEFGEFHSVGLKRNDVDPFNSKPNFYLDHLVEMSEEIERILILDPMFATGGTMVAVVGRLRKKYKFDGKIDIVCLIAAKEGVEKILDKFQNIKITCAGYDEKLNKKGYIVPGLGDAGDRFFGIKTKIDNIN